MADINWQLVSYIIVGLASGLTGAIIAPLIHWRIEKKRQERQHKYELVQQWRDMLAQLSKTLDHDEGRPNAPMYYLERDAAFLSLEEHLSTDTIRSLLGGRTLIVPPDGSTTEGFVLRLRNEVSRIEREWGLLGRTGFFRKIFRSS